MDGVEVVVGTGVDVGLVVRVGVIVGVSVDAIVAAAVKAGRALAGAQLDKSRIINKIRERFFILSCLISR